MKITNNTNDEVIHVLAIIDQLETLQELFDEQFEDVRDYFAFSRVIKFLKRQEKAFTRELDWWEFM